MKRFLAAIVFFGGVFDQAVADCSGTQVTASTTPTLTALLTGNTVCGTAAGNTSGNPNGRWQEQHVSGGQLIDYKMGASDPKDPTKQVGLWAINGNTVEYSYFTHGTTTPNTPYIFTVHLASGTLGDPAAVYHFCSGGAAQGAGRVQAAANCSSYPTAP
jgi:hypothetical protein